jgi:hypothetical protein
VRNGRPATEIAGFIQEIFAIEAEVIDVKRRAGGGVFQGAAERWKAWDTA